MAAIRLCNPCNIGGYRIFFTGGAVGAYIHPYPFLNLVETCAGPLRSGPVFYLLYFMLSLNLVLAGLVLACRYGTLFVFFFKLDLTLEQIQNYLCIH